MRKPQVFTVQPMVLKAPAPSLAGLIDGCAATAVKTRLSRQCTPLALAALSASVLLGGAAWATATHLAAVHYQPEGIVIQIADGKMAAPSIETWPNIRDGVKTELILVRMPGCTGDYTSLQQVGSQEINGHSEVKQFWITPFSTDPKAEQGTQVVLEVETPAEAPEFTPQVLSQGHDQWVITLQGKTNRPNGPWSLEAKTPSSPEDVLTPVTPEPQADAEIKSARHPQGKATQQAHGVTAASGQSLLAALNQSKQRQAEMGLQLAASQQALAESHAQEVALQARLSSYENILESAGVDPKKEERLEATAVIQNLRSALVKVAQKLKAAEESLAQKQNDASILKAPLSVRSDPRENLLPIAALGLAETSQTPPTAPTLTPGHKALPPSGKPTNVSKPVMTAVPKNLPSVPSASPAANKLALPSANSPIPVKQSGSVQTKKEDPEATLKLALQKTPFNADGYLNLADFYVARKDWANAKSTLLMLTRMKPDNAQSYYYLALIGLQQKDKKNAQAMLTQYAQRNPGDAPGIQKLKKAIQGKPSSNAPTP
jgi:tetratricopeptide (TPR) repeat protein